MKKNEDIYSANDISKVLARQLNILDSGKSGEEDLKIAEQIFNGVGKMIKHAALRMAYRTHKKEGGSLISELESRGEG